MDGCKFNSYLKEKSSYGQLSLNKLAVSHMQTIRENPKKGANFASNSEQPYLQRTKLIHPWSIVGQKHFIEHGPGNTSTSQETTRRHGLPRLCKDV